MQEFWHQQTNVVETKIGDWGKNEMTETFWKDEAEVEWKGDSLEKSRNQNSPLGELRK